MAQHSNADYSGNWAKAQPPVLGHDNNGGGDIEQRDPGTGEWKNPRVRINFFTRAEKLDYYTRFKTDTGMSVGELVQDKDYVMAEGENRTAERFIIEGMIYDPAQAQGTALGLLRAISSDGKDAAGVLLYPDDVYDIGVGHPGKFTCTPISNWQGDTLQIGFVPALKSAVSTAPDPNAKPTTPPDPGYEWRKGLMGWAQAPVDSLTSEDRSSLIAMLKKLLGL